MAISYSDSRLVPLVETDPVLRRAASANEMLEERSKMESAATPAMMTVLGVEMVVKNTFLEEVAADEAAAKLRRCSSAPGFLTAWSQPCLSDAHRVAADRRATGKVSSDAISKKCAQCGDDDDDASPCSTTGTPSSTLSSWADSEDYDYELSIAGFAMDTPVRAGSAGAPAAAAAASGIAKGAAPQAPPKKAPKIVTTIMVQNLKRSVTRADFMLSLDSQGFAGKYDFVHLPKSFGTARNNGCAFVNFLKLEDAEEFARSIACLKGSKMRAVPADVQGSANVAKANSRKKNRIRTDTCRPLVVSGHGQDVLLHA